MKNKKILLIMLAIGYYSLLNAVPINGFNSNLLPDSLKAKYLQAKTIEAQINVLNDAGYYLESQSPQQSIEISLIVLRLADSANYLNGMLEANNNLGLAFYRTSKYRQALTCFKEAEKLAIITGNELKQASVNSNMSLVYNSLSDYERSLFVNYQALKFRIKANDTLGMANSFNNIGMTHHLKGDFNVARHFYNRALELKKEKNDKVGIGNTLNNIGQMFYEMYTDTSQWALDSALVYYLEAYNSFNQTGNRVGLAQVLPNIANVYAQDNTTGKALDAFRAALNSQKQIADSAGIANTYFNMGLLFLNDGDVKIAKDYFNRSIDIARNLSSAELVRDNLQELFYIVKNEGDSKNAILYASEFLSINDSIDAMSRKMLIEEYNNKFTYQLQENIELKKTLSTSRIWMIVLTSISLTLIGLVFLWWYMRRKNRE